MCVCDSVGYEWAQTAGFLKSTLHSAPRGTPEQLSVRSLAASIGQLSSLVTQLSYNCSFDIKRLHLTLQIQKDLVAFASWLLFQEKNLITPFSSLGDSNRFVSLKCLLPHLVAFAFWILYSAACFKSIDHLIRMIWFSSTPFHLKSRLRDIFVLSIVAILYLIHVSYLLQFFFNYSFESINVHV